MRPISHAPFSYLGDPQVPPFDQGRILLVMDAECSLCSVGARRVARWDTDDRVRIAPVQSPLGAALLQHYGMAPDDPDTWLVIQDGRAYGSLQAMAQFYPQLRIWLRPVSLLNWLPRRLQDWLYARLARNRYALFGKGNMCTLPDPELRRRLIQ
ncbi:thiol-disulfide oxidoreductase [Actibacterium mucosum KCTC 23349]|uniref:Thiol-disulfide oxidoreductase n=1 Tax=Actibacterium mucosum KCTC 23349 TaxID=1454373 RepID=A0A037ZJG1_9RHOB|nr:DCC1-like thiol-disulfide oxidoreductase family protein [Actibacterium mucosum]KAJ54926.1 thiol-disulfide oxidoreductase [Actibacterium mucosum KCTC 23349]